MQNAATKNRVNHSLILAGVQILVGIIMLGVLIAAGVAEIVSSVFYGLSMVWQAVVMFILAFSQFAVLLTLGIRGFMLAARYRRLVRLMSSVNRMPVRAVADEFGVSCDKLLTEIALMERKGFFMKDAGIDADRKEFVGTADGSLPRPLDENDTTMLVKKTRFSRLPWLYFAGVLAAYTAFRFFSSIWDLIIAFSLAAVVFVIGVVKTPKVGTYEEAPRPVIKPEPVSTGNVDVDGALTTGMDYMAKLLELDRQITSPSLDEPVRQLASISKEIFEVVRADTRKVRQIREFMNYYLPTTLKLLQEYVDFEKHAVKGENVTESMRKIEGVIDSIVLAFKRELDNLYFDKAIDISADIEVMRSMIGDSITDEH